MNRLLATTSIALLAATTPGWAEITPAQVWDHLVQQYQSMGYTVTEGSREEAGDTLTITDAKVAVDGEMSDMTMTFPKLVMNQTGDGNVRWTMDGAATGEVTMPAPEGGEDQTTTFTVDMPGNETVTSGSVEDLTHDFKAQQMLVTLNMPLAETGETMPVSMTFDGVAGKQRSVRSDAGEETTFDSTADKVAVNAKADMPKTADGGPGALALDGTAEDLTMTGRMMMAPGDFNMETQLEEALQAGTAFDFTLTYAGSNGTFSFSGPGEDGTPQSADGSYSSGPGSASFGLSQAGLKYATAAETIDTTMNIGTLPFPLSYQLAKGGFDLEMPVMGSDQPAPFKLLTSITGLAINDEIWAMFDPEAKLARDPADLNIDLSGEVLMPESILTPPAGLDAAMDKAADGAAGEDAAATDTADAEAAADAATAAAEAAAAAAAAAGGETPDAADSADAGTDAATGTDAPHMADMPQPPVPVRVTLNDVSINAVGAQAKFSGELTAPEGGDMTTAPVGEISGELTGVNALLDTLGAMGLVPQDQMMGAKMMLTMFAKPVEGQPDKLQTKLEFREGGSIFANGQQVK